MEKSIPTTNINSKRPILLERIFYFSIPWRCRQILVLGPFKTLGERIPKVHYDFKETSTLFSTSEGFQWGDTLIHVGGIMSTSKGVQ